MRIEVRAGQGKAETKVPRGRDAARCKPRASFSRDIQVQ